MNIPKSVSAYEDECAAIMSWLSTDTWLHQDEFDRLSREWRWDKKRRRRIPGYTDDTIIPPMNGDLLVAILQELQCADLVEARELHGEIEYRLAATKSVPAPRSDPNPALFSGRSVYDESKFEDGTKL